MTSHADKRIFGYIAADLFGAVFGYDSAAEAEFLLNHLDMASDAELRLMTSLLRQVRHNFVFEQAGFVVRFLERCHSRDDKVLDDAVSALSAAATSGMRSGVVGQPMPRDVSDHAKAIAILDGLSKMSPAYELYDYIRRHAASNIAERDAEDWEDD